MSKIVQNSEAADLSFVELGDGQEPAMAQWAADTHLRSLTLLSVKWQHFKNSHPPPPPLAIPRARESSGSVAHDNFNRQVASTHDLCIPLCWSSLGRFACSIAQSLGQGLGVSGDPDRDSETILRTTRVAPSLPRSFPLATWDLLSTFLMIV